MIVTSLDTLPPFVLLTGQDHSIRTSRAIETLPLKLEPYIGKSPLPYSGWGAGGGLGRLRK
jgi:hypothetical protein